jgi:transposase-like protein
MRDLLKCPHCHSPLERKEVTSEEIRYRCGVCGHQTAQKLPKKEAVEEPVVDPKAVSSE